MDKLEDATQGMTPMARRRRPGGRSARVRAAAIAATLAELAETGYSALSLENVARRAGVHKTTLYRRWGLGGGGDARPCR
jgi:AcrR family transcriptional regulator